MVMMMVVAVMVLIRLVESELNERALLSQSCGRPTDLSIIPSIKLALYYCYDSPVVLVTSLHDAGKSFVASTLMP